MLLSFGAIFAAASMFFASAASGIGEYLMGWNAASIICLIVGLVLMVIEMLMPGIGISGIGGGIALIAAIVIRADTFGEAMLTLALIVIVLVIAGVLVMVSFNRGLLSRTAIMLNDTIDSKSTTISDNETKELIGKVGVVKNELRPTGFAEIDGKRVDVVTRGDFVEKGATVEVVAVEGLNIIVRKVGPATERETESTDTTDENL